MADKNKSKERLGDLLVNKGVITPEQLDQAVQCQVLFGGRLGTNLLELGFVKEDVLRELLEEKYGLFSVTKAELKDIPAEAYKLVTADVAEKHKVLPVRINYDALETAMLDPWRESGIQVLTELSSLHVQPLVALELDILWGLEKYYGVRREARLINLDNWLEHQRETTEPPVKKSSSMYGAEPLLPDPQSITAVEGAPMSLEDFWDRVGRTSRPEYLLPRVLKDLAAAESRDEIAEVLLDYSAMIFRRTLLFVINEDMLFGWDARGEGMDKRLALAVMLPLTRRSVFRTVVETGAYFLGPVPDSPVNRRFMAALGDLKPRTVLLLPIMVSGKVVAILYGDMGHEQGVQVNLTPLQNALSAAGAAFHRLILKQKSPKPDAPG